MQKAVYYLGQSLDACSDFDSKIIGEMEDQVRYMILKTICGGEQTEMACMMMEMIQQSVHKRMVNLTLFVVNELYKLYFKIACDTIEMRSDTTTARKYLT